MERIGAIDYKGRRAGHAIATRLVLVGDDLPRHLRAQGITQNKDQPVPKHRGSWAIGHM
jgi:hypothetical protein